MKKWWWLVVLMVWGLILYWAGKGLMDPTAKEGHGTAVPQQAIRTVTPMATEAATPSITPHLRLTQIENERQEASSELEKARLEAEAIHLVADANASEVRMVGEAQAEAAERLLSPRQTDVALRQTEAAMMETELALKGTATRQAGEAEFWDASIKAKNAQAQAKSDLKAWVIILGVGAILAALVGSTWITGIYHKRREEMERAVIPEIERYEVAAIPMKREEYHALFRNWANQPKASPTAIAGLSFPVSGNPSTVMIEKAKLVRTFMDHSPTRFGYNDFLHDYSSRSRNVVEPIEVWGGGGND